MRRHVLRKKRREVPNEGNDRPFHSRNRKSRDNTPKNEPRLPQIVAAASVYRMRRDRSDEEPNSCSGKHTAIDSLRGTVCRTKRRRPRLPGLPARKRHDSATRHGANGRKDRHAETGAYPHAIPQSPLLHRGPSRRQSLVRPLRSPAPILSAQESHTYSKAASEAPHNGATTGIHA